MEDQRLHDLKNWLDTQLDNIQQVSLLAGDASFRRYARVTTQESTYIAMDAPPIKESCERFVAIANEFRRIGVNTPLIIAEDLTQGFLLLSDFGDTVLNHILTPQTADNYYQKCFDQLVLIQKHQQLENYPLPLFNNGIYSYYEESSWFLTWYLQQYCNIKLSSHDLAQIEREIHFVATETKQQPQTIIHRDYHSRNIMYREEGAFGILDFQDASIGAITYDLVSLLRDCYIDWPPEKVRHWVSQYHQQLVDADVAQVSAQEFQYWFDMAGLQRHLKCAGLFVRLNLRDNKPAYLQYIPRVLGYIAQETMHVKELTLLNQLVYSPCEA